MGGSGSRLFFKFRDELPIDRAIMDRSSSDFISRNRGGGSRGRDGQLRGLLACAVNIDYAAPFDVIDD